MSSSQSALTSTVARKYFMGFSGLAFFGFLITHLTANSLLLLPHSEPFNGYALLLHDLGEILYVLEAGLLAVFLLHVATAIVVTAANRSTRDQGYNASGNAGGASKKTFASRSMIYTGIVILVFTVIHVWTIKFGPGIEEGYVTELRGQQARDLYTMVQDKFSNPAWVGFYAVCMVALGIHLKHGIWSGLQSIGFAHPKYTPRLYTLGTLVAAIMAIGFMMIPIIIFLRGSV